MQRDHSGRREHCSVQLIKWEAQRKTEHHQSARNARTLLMLPARWPGTSRRRPPVDCRLIPVDRIRACRLYRLTTIGLDETLLPALRRLDRISTPHDALEMEPELP